MGGYARYVKETRLTVRPYKPDRWDEGQPQGIMTEEVRKLSRIKLKASYDR